MKQTRMLNFYSKLIPYILVIHILVITIFLIEYVDWPTIPTKKKVQDDSPRNMTKEMKTKHVIIWSHSRSGSTLTAEVLSKIANTYYIHEPVTRFRGFKKPISQKETETLQDLLRKVLQCNFSHPNVFWKSFLSKDLMWMWPQRDLHFDKELHDLMQLESTGRAFCEAADVVLVKQVALGMISSLDLLKDQSLDLYIIHLVRDPRGTFTSTKKMLDDNDLHRDMEFRLDNILHCDKLREDIDVGNSLQSKYPQRYLRVQYEELIIDMDKQIGKIIKWLGLPYEPRISATVADLTMGFYARNAHNSLFHPIRNASATRFAWRQKLDYDDVVRVQDGCRDVLGDLGYRIYNTLDEYLNPLLMPLFDELF